MVENEHVKMTDEQYARNISKLKKLLADQPLSDLQVSRNCGFSQGAVNFLKNGHTLGTAETWDAIGKYFNVTFEYEMKKPFKGIIRKKKKIKIIEDSMLNILKEKGNLYIGPKKLKKFGEKAILDEVKSHGIDCTAHYPITDGKGFILEVLPGKR